MSGDITARKRKEAYLGVKTGLQEMRFYADSALAWAKETGEEALIEQVSWIGVEIELLLREHPELQARKWLRELP